MRYVEGSLNLIVNVPEFSAPFVLARQPPGENLSVQVWERNCAIMSRGGYNSRIRL